MHREIPQELIQLARGGEVNLNMEDHRHEDFIKPPSVVQPFSGEGHRLGWYGIYFQLLSFMFTTETVVLPSVLLHSRCINSSSYNI